MTLYKELVESYRGTIDRIKSNRARVTQLNHEINELAAIHNCHERADFAAIADLVEEASELSEGIAEDRAEMDYEVHREYERVPFIKTRNQGITGFYRLAGLEPL